MDLIFMKRPKWLSEWGNGKKVFEVKLVIDVPGVKVVEACSDEKTVLIAIGASKKLVAESAEQTEHANESEHPNESEIRWKIFYDKTAFSDLMPFEKVRDFMAGVAAIACGSATAYHSDTLYIAVGEKPFKGNAPHILDYRIAKRIEEAKHTC